MAKFKAGEIAIFVGPFANTFGDKAPFAVGQEVKIDAVCVAAPPRGKDNIQWYEVADFYVAEHNLRKRPGPEDFKKSLEPCDKQFPAQLDRWLTPVKELESTMRGVFPSVEELERLQPFDHFFGGFDG